MAADGTDPDVRRPRRPEAVYANSERCKELLGRADLTLTDVGDVDHITSLVLSIPRVAHWFATLK
jgi:hypothetical protein